MPNLLTADRRVPTADQRRAVAEQRRMIRELLSEAGCTLTVAEVERWVRGEPAAVPAAVPAGEGRGDG